MTRSKKLLMAASAAAIAISSQAQAADMSVPEVIEPPIYYPPQVEKHKKVSTGWYLRGDIGYSFNGDIEAPYVTQGDHVNGTNVLTGELDDSYVIGAGVGAQITDFLRADVTLDYLGKTDFTGSTIGVCTDATTFAAVECVSSDTATFSALSLMANAYVDLGTYGRITPYVGAGIGGAHVKWGTLTNCIDGGHVQDGCVDHDGHKEWRFAYALHAGAAIDITCATSIDVGYRYKRIEGGKMFKYAEADFGSGHRGAGGPGYDDGMDLHQVRAGLRYKFGAHDCHPKVEHHPQPLPPIYK